MEFWGILLGGILGSTVGGPEGMYVGGVSGAMLQKIVPGVSDVLSDLFAELGADGIRSASARIIGTLEASERQQVRDSLESALSESLVASIHDIGGSACFPDVMRLKKAGWSNYVNYPIALLHERDKEIAEDVCALLQQLAQEAPIQLRSDPASQNTEYLYLNLRNEEALSNTFFDTVIFPLLSGHGDVLDALDDLKDESGLEIFDVTSHLRRHLFNRTLVHLGRSLRDRSSVWRLFVQLLLETLSEQVRIGLANLETGQETIVSRLDALESRLAEPTVLASLSSVIAELVVSSGSKDDTQSNVSDEVITALHDQSGLLSNRVIDEHSATRAAVDEWGNRIINSLEMLAMSFQESVMEGQRQKAVATKRLFYVPYARDLEFVGREETLKDIQAVLQSGRKLALTGVGGIGKTEIAIEYAYRSEIYDQGVFWLTASQNWTPQLLSLAKRLQLDSREFAPASGQTDDEKLIMGFVSYLTSHPMALLIIDNIEDPKQLYLPIFGTTLSQFACHILVTTRHGHPGSAFPALEIDELDEVSALRLLLHRRETAIGPRTSALEVDAARRICHVLGYFPLALALAGAYLGRYTGITITEYRKRLETHGPLATIDSSGVAIHELSTRHNPIVKTTLAEHWQVIESSNARSLLMAMALFADAEQIPVRRLSLLTDLTLLAARGFPSPIDEAIGELRTLSLVRESVTVQKEWGKEAVERRLSMHPLVRSFITGLVTDITQLVATFAGRLEESLWDLARLESEIKDWGMFPVLSDLRATIALLDQYPSRKGDYHKKQIAELKRLLDLELYNLIHRTPDHQEGFILQQLRNRCLQIDQNELLAQAESQLALRQLPYLRERFRLLQSSDALLKTIPSEARKVYVTPDCAWIVALSLKSKSAVVFDINSGRYERTLGDDVVDFACSARAPTVVGLTKNSIKVWSLDSWDETEYPLPLKNPITNICISPNGKFFAGHTEDGLLMVWEVGKSAITIVTTGLSNKEPSFAFTVDDQFLVVKDVDSFRLFDVFEGNEVNCVDLAEVFSLNDLQRGAFKTDGRFLIYQSSRGYEIVELTGLLDSASRYTGPKLLDLVKGNDRLASAVSSWLSSASSEDPVFLLRNYRIFMQRDGTFLVWKTAALPWLIPDGPCATKDLEIASSGLFAVKTVSCLHSDAVEEGWRVEADLVVHEASVEAVNYLRGHGASVKCVTISADSRFIVSAEEQYYRSDPDATIKVWDRNYMHQASSQPASEGHRAIIHAVAATRNGGLVVSASADGTLKLWELESGSLVKTLSGHRAPVRGVAITPDDRKAVSVSADGTLKVWSLQRGEILSEIEVTGNYSGSTARAAGDHLNAVDIDVEGKYAAVATGFYHYYYLMHGTNEYTDCAVKVIDLETGTVRRTLYGHEGPVTSVKITSDNRYILSTATDGTVRIWDFSTGESVQVYKKVLLNGYNTAVTCTPDNRLGIVGGQHTLLYVFDIQTGSHISTLESYLSLTGAINGVSVDNSGRFIIVASHGAGSLKVWDIAEEKLALILRADFPLTCCTITSSGKTIIAGDLAGNMHFLDWVRDYSQ